ncbi:MAG: hypothetical protein R6V85_03525 [Polyangia bacterium]
MALPLALPICLALSPPALGEDKLDEVREEVREPSGEGRDPDQGGAAETPYWGDGHHIEDYEGSYACPPGDPNCQTGSETDAAEVLLGYGLGFLFWLPHVIIEGPDPRDGWFAGPPYSGGKRGHMRFEPWFQDEPRAETTEKGDLLIGAGEEPGDDGGRTARPLSLRLSAEYGHDIDDLYKPSAELLLSTSLRFGLQGGVTWFREETVDGVDQLLVWDANAIFRFAQHEAVEMRSGIGARLMHDFQAAARIDAGFNFTYGLDIFPVDPLVLSASIDLGNLGYAFVAHGRGQIGVTRWGVEIYAGWDAMWIGKVPLHGPILGLRGWI